MDARTETHARGVTVCRGFFPTSITVCFSGMPCLSAIGQFTSTHPGATLHPSCSHAGTRCAGAPAAGRGCFSHSCQSHGVGDEPLSATAPGVLTPISFHSKAFLETSPSCELCPWCRISASASRRGVIFAHGNPSNGEEAVVPRAFRNNL